MNTGNAPFSLCKNIRFLLKKKVDACSLNVVFVFFFCIKIFFDSELAGGTTCQSFLLLKPKKGSSEQLPGLKERPGLHSSHTRHIFIVFPVMDQLFL